jgi:hypothetical protein
MKVVTTGQKVSKASSYKWWIPKASSYKYGHQVSANVLQNFCFEMKILPNFSWETEMLETQLIYWMLSNLNHPYNFISTWARWWEIRSWKSLFGSLSGTCFQLLQRNDKCVQKWDSTGKMVVVMFTIWAWLTFLNPSVRLFKTKSCLEETVSTIDL